MIAKLWDALARLNPRERALILIAAPVLLVAAMYLVVLEPLILERERLETARTEAVEFQTWFQRAAARLVKGEVQTAPGNVRLASLVEETINTHQLGAWKRRQLQDGDGNTVVNFTEVPYTRFIAWLVELTDAHFVVVEQISIEAAAREGLVDVRVMLKQAA